MKKNQLSLTDPLALEVEYKRLNFEDSISLKFKIDDNNNSFDLSNLIFSSQIIDKLSGITLFELDSEIDTGIIFFFKRMYAVVEFQIYIPQIDIETAFTDKLLTYRTERDYQINLTLHFKDISKRIDYTKTIQEEFIC